MSEIDSLSEPVEENKSQSSSIGVSTWNPRIGGIFWEHIYEGHMPNSGGSAKGVWHTSDKSVIASYVREIFEANKAYLKPHLLGKQNKRLWGQSYDYIGVTGSGERTKGIIIFVKIERADGRCKIMNAYPGEYE